MGLDKVTTYKLNDFFMQQNSIQLLIAIIAAIMMLEKE